MGISCEKHGKSKMSLKRVRKQGPNISRLFFTCSVPGCTFFKWADTQFPLCNCAARQHSVLKVSKKETSGGRWFFACRGGQGKGCNYFAWASPSQLQPLQGLLNPLT